MGVDNNTRGIETFPEQHVGRFAPDAVQRKEFFEGLWDFSMVAFDDPRTSPGDAFRLLPKETARPNVIFEFLAGYGKVRVWVTMLTRSSVHWAARIVPTRS